jgi:hypothetical protein
VFPLLSKEQGEVPAAKIGSGMFGYARKRTVLSREAQITKPFETIAEIGKSTTSVLIGVDGGH